IVEHKKNAPLAHDILNPDHWDEKRINEMLHRYCQKINVTVPVAALKHQTGFHELNKSQRHNIEKILFATAYAKFKKSDPGLPENVSVTWTDKGRPRFNETDDAGISCSHDERLCICSIGWQDHGCDLETVVHQDKEEWLNLLGNGRQQLLEKCAAIDRSADHAGTRIWCALEALRKATDLQGNTIESFDKVEDAIIFKAGDISILTFAVKLLRGRERILAFTARAEKKPVKLESLPKKRVRQQEDFHWGSFIHDDLLKRKVFTTQLPISLRDNATTGGGVYFANYLHWLGKVREMSLKPIGKYIADEFFNGHFMVTNHSKVDVVGELRNHENLAARLWVDKIFGNKNSSLVLKCEWSKHLPDGNKKTVAFGEQQATWVKVVGHGIVEPVPCPGFFQNYLEEKGFAPQTDSPVSGHPNTLAGNANPASLGKLILATKAGMNGTASLLAKSFDTSMENSNLAQNIYFSNYFIWQGHVRDRYFFDISPENYRKMNGNGQLLCLHSSVKHLREAMPFDRIRTTMYLKKLHACGLELYFEYHKIDPAGTQEKIAFGDHTLGWVNVDSHGNYALGELPDLYVQAMLKANGAGHG
ncbi:MAG: hypothetical protein R3297_09340, partial [Desulfobulbales bacterium]|nr:hypothetical protein [Desulfobulbales bacterium]